MPSSHLQPGRRERGFTLIELMITVAIIGILGAIAYPAYLDSVLKGKRAEGRTALTDLMQQQERYFTQTGTYLSFAAGATGIAFKTFSGDNAASPAYKLGAEACALDVSLRECVRVFAVPQFTDDDGGTLRIRSTGLRDCTGAKPAVCWR
ncbi:MAG: type IV pilin protein [Ideonella sp.]|nr:type IV pilin protein [Ideonella sp.]